MGSFLSMDDFNSLLKYELKEHLIQEFANFSIIVEADLQTSIGMWLRNYISKHQNENWRVFNQLQQFQANSKTGKKNRTIYPDVLLTRRKDVKSGIELKQSVGRDDRVPFEHVLNDVHKMGAYGTDLGIDTYVIWTVYIGDEEKINRLEQQLVSAAESYEHPPRVLLVNLFGSISGGHSWFARFNEYVQEWRQYNPEVG